MLRHIDATIADRRTMAADISRLASSEDVLLFRRGAQLGPDEWIELLTTDCGLTADRRHFDAEWAAADAAKHAAAFGAHDLSVSASGATAALSDRAGKFGHAIWAEISYQPDKAAAYAYSKTAQPLHTDNAWFSEPAEISFFIMKKRAVSGGEQTIYPMSRLLDDLNREEPGLFSELCNTEVIIKKGDHGDYNRTTIIRLGPNPALFWNYYRVERASEDVSRMCEAFFLFLKRKAQTNAVERLRCDTGDCFCFNDTKLLHGRTSYEAQVAFDRILMHSTWKLSSTAHRNLPGR